VKTPGGESMDLGDSRNEEGKVRHKEAGRKAYCPTKGGHGENRK